MSDEFTDIAAMMLDEAYKLVQEGFHYVSDIESEKVFRMRKKSDV